MIQISLKNSKTISRILLLPLIISIFAGIIVGLFDQGITNIIEKNKELTAVIEDPNIYLDESSFNNTTIKINEIEITKLVTYEITISNSGNQPITEVPIRFDFNSENPSFRIINITHNTKPEYEFGKIIKEEINNSTIKFTYELLNPGDQDKILFITNELTEIKLYSKVEGMKFNLITPSQSFNKKTSEYTSIIVIISAFLTSITTVLAFIKKTTRDEYKRLETFVRKEDY